MADESKWTVILWTIILALTALALLALMLRSTGALAQTPPYCQGTNRVLQYSSAGWLCSVITGTVGPQGPKGDQGEPGPQGAPGPQGPAWTLPPAPPPSQCITSSWDGSAWICVPTNFLEAK